MVLSSRAGRGLGAALLAACVGLTVAPAAAQLSPSQPIKIVVSAPAGGIGDLAARIMAQRLTDDGRPAIVENRVGGNGIVATDAIAKARPDGYTLIIGNHSTLAILPHMTKVNYDPARDFVPVALMVAAPNVLVVKASLPVNSVREIVAYGKARPLTNASQGIGASGHLIGEQFRQLTGVELTHVHYRGAALAVQDVVAGHVDLMFDVVSLTREQVLSGQLRALAILSPQRNPVLPDVPTAAEAGLSGFESAAWFALLAPRGTPKAIVDKLNATAVAALGDADLRKRLADIGADPAPMSPDDLRAFISAEVAKWRDIITRGAVSAEP